MKIRIPSAYVLEKVDKWFESRDSWVRRRYNKDVARAMKPSWSNFWLGRSKSFAKIWLDNVHCGIHRNYRERLEDRFWLTATKAEGARKLAKVSLYCGDGFILSDSDDLCWLEDI